MTRFFAALLLVACSADHNSTPSLDAGGTGGAQAPDATPPDAPPVTESGGASAGGAAAGGRGPGGASAGGAATGGAPEAGGAPDGGREPCPTSWTVLMGRSGVEVATPARLCFEYAGAAECVTVDAAPFAETVTAPDGGDWPIREALKLPRWKTNSSWTLTLYPAGCEAGACGLSGDALVDLGCGELVELRFSVEQMDARQLVATVEVVGR